MGLATPVNNPSVIYQCRAKGASFARIPDARHAICLDVGHHEANKFDGTPTATLEGVWRAMRRKTLRCPASGRAASQKERRQVLPW